MFVLFFPIYSAHSDDWEVDFSDYDDFPSSSSDAPAAARADAPREGGVITLSDYEMDSDAELFTLQQAFEEFEPVTDPDTAKGEMSDSDSDAVSVHNEQN